MIGKVLTTASFIFCASMAWSETVIAALGDSLTQGFGLPQEQGFVPQLQSWLAEQGHPARLINAGVSGDTTAGGLARVAWTLTDEVDGMIVALGGNDLLRGIDPTVSRANVDGILQAAADKGVPVLLVGMQAPGNYGPDYKAAFDAIYPDLAQAYDAVYLDSFFAGFGPSRDNPAQVQAFLQPDGIHPNAEGVAKIVAGIGPKVVELLARVETP